MNGVNAEPLDLSDIVEHILYAEGLIVILLTINNALTLLLLSIWHYKVYLHFLVEHDVAFGRVLADGVAGIHIPHI